MSKSLKFRNIKNIENILGETVIVEIVEKRIYQVDKLPQDKLNNLIKEVLEINIDSEDLLVENGSKLISLMKASDKYSPEELVSMITIERSKSTINKNKPSDKRYKLRKERENKLLSFLEQSEF